MARPPMTVQLAPVGRADLTEHLMVVGNLIGAATVQVVPKVSGRLSEVLVRLGDPVRRGQVLARVEDREIREQVKQAEASFEVARATVRQRDADLQFAQTALERARSLFARQLLARQALDDAEARYQAALAQLDLARAQFAQAQARLEELRITLANTAVTSPVDGFVGRRYLDPGAFASTNAPVVSVVDIRSVRLVANVVERDLRRVQPGTPADVDVDAFPGERFAGRVARVAPVLDPATRTAEIEVEIPNTQFRLKPGMYARVRLAVERRPQALVVPRNAVVDLDGRRGVFVVGEDGRTAVFRAVELGLQEGERVEIRSGVAEGERVVTAGAAALRDGDPIIVAERAGGGAEPPAGRPGSWSGRSPQRPGADGGGGPRRPGS
jgi:membrane fusion protein (multidrug efflux system)